MEKTDNSETKADSNYARKSLVSEAEEKEFLLYALLHDLKTPVSYLNALFESIKGNSETGDSAEILRRAEGAIADMDSTFEKLNELMKLKRNRENPEPPATFSGIFEQVCSSELMEDLKEAEITAKFESCDMISYPEVYLKLFFSHLISNALAGKAPERQLHIYLCSQKLGDHVLLTIRDNGKGMKKQEIETLFQPNSLSRSNAGDVPQPGLYIIKSLVEKNGGHIVVDSTPNVGTTLTLYLREYKN